MPGTVPPVLLLLVAMLVLLLTLFTFMMLLPNQPAVMDVRSHSAYPTSHGRSMLFRGSRHPAAVLPSHHPLLSSGRDHLILYAFSASDPEAVVNLRYFIDNAVIGDDVADVIIIVQQGGGLQNVSLPELPMHAQYVPHANECYDWGSYGWLLLRSGHVNVTAYRYFFFINSSVRGPFMPAYARVRGLPAWACVPLAMQ